MHIPENNLLGRSVIAYKNNNLYLQKSSLAGNGVFSKTQIEKGELIERCPLILFSEGDMEFLKHTNIYNYYSYKNDKDENSFLALGFGSIYNHASPSNAEYEIDADSKTLSITAAYPINAGDEITINYNGKYDDKTRVVFRQKDEVYEFSVNLF